MDTRKQFTSKEFVQLTNSTGTKIKIVPMEAHHLVGIVERYHNMVQRAYKIIIAEINRINKDVAL